MPGCGRGPGLLLLLLLLFVLLLPAFPVDAGAGAVRFAGVDAREPAPDVLLLEEDCHCCIQAAAAAPFLPAFGLPLPLVPLAAAVLLVAPVLVLLGA